MSLQQPRPVRASAPPTPADGRFAARTALRPWWRWSVWGVGLAVLAALAGCGTPAPRPGAASAPATSDRDFGYDGGSVTATQTGAACELRWQGALHAGAVPRLRQALDAVDRQRCERRTLVLGAVDGAVGEAITIGAMVRNRGWDTAIAPGGLCRTPCWLVFAAGAQRHMADGPTPARVVFSQIPPDADFGRQTCATELSRAQQLTLTRYLRAMLPPPTATAVYQKLLAADCRSAEAYGPQQARLIGLATGPGGSLP